MRSFCVANTMYDVARKKRRPRVVDDMLALEKRYAAVSPQS